MANHVCPWWLGYLLACPLRRYLQDPGKILGPYVREGMTVLEPGPGMGFFTLELARLVGPSGRVIAVDIQPKMISGLKRRLARAGLLDRVDVRLGRSDSMGIADLAGTVHFILAAAVVHELPAAAQFFADAAKAAKPGATMLFFEPAGHVNEDKLQEELSAAAAAGFVVADRPAIRRSHAAVLRKV
ncbi:MAG TPA: methyltransferase domain-containing protein [Terriglobales bacterium]|nr:methyltransferase domain-containing protein [Terriglobales bacterium]